MMARLSDRNQRAYPDFYEKFIPIAIWLLTVLIFGMIAFTVAVGAGIIQFG